MDEFAKCPEQLLTTNLEIEKRKINKPIVKNIEFITKISQNSNERFKKFYKSLREPNKTNVQLDEVENNTVNTQNTDYSKNWFNEEKEYIMEINDFMEQSNEITLKEEMLTNLKYNFVWKINNFTKNYKNNTSYNSDYFYKYNYKLCLHVDLNKTLFSDYFRLFTVIMKGENDDKIEWPMKHTIFIGILNQSRTKVHRHWKCNYNMYKDKSVFNKPNSFMNTPIYCGWIYVSDIQHVKGILLEDSIIIQCAVKE